MGGWFLFMSFLGGGGTVVSSSTNRYSVAASGFVVPGATAAGTFEPVVAGNRSAQ